jgi:acyl carrier protein
LRDNSNVRLGLQIGREADPKEVVVVDDQYVDLSAVWLIQSRLSNHTGNLGRRRRRSTWPFSGSRERIARVGSLIGRTETQLRGTVVEMDGCAVSARADIGVQDLIEERDDGGVGTLDSTRARIRQVLTEHARLSGPLDQLPDNADLFDAGMTSHASVSVMLALEDAFDLEFPDSMLKRNVFETVNSIAAALAEVAGSAR